nr:MAG TPA: hypothetical protein [Caudoviricetes sp.]
MREIIAVGGCAIREAENCLGGRSFIPRFPKSMRETSLTCCGRP